MQGGCQRFPESSQVSICCLKREFSHQYDLQAEYRRRYFPFNSICYSGQIKTGAHDFFRIVFITGGIS